MFDANLALTAWNREFADLFDLPPALLRHRRRARRDRPLQRRPRRLRPGRLRGLRRRARRVACSTTTSRCACRLFSSRRVIEIRSARLPDGGIVTTYTDITQTVQTEEALEAANELLEKRVDERTAEFSA